MNIQRLGVIAGALFTPAAAIADENAFSNDDDSVCPVTVGTVDLLEPGSRNFYGSEALAVTLPHDGTLQVTGLDARIAAKLFWFIPGFRPGMQTHLSVEIRNLNGGPNDAVVRDVTTANAMPSNWETSEDVEKAQFDDQWLDGWAMLTGIDFPSPGCWEITGEYVGQSLTFIVETVLETP
ncbi:MAG TPA: hypothetical protein PKK10_06610 [Woeseiaceae bacterium]|nr:hypothetical protein [Woeseiaceae bacterium]